MRRPDERPDKVIVIGRAAIDPDRPDPMHLRTGGLPMTDDVTKADKTGIYITNGVPQRFKAGEVIPDGAKLRDASDEPLVETPRTAEKAAIAADDAKRARGKAPENRSK